VTRGSCSRCLSKAGPRLEDSPKWSGSLSISAGGAHMEVTQLAWLLPKVAELAQRHRPLWSSVHVVKLGCIAPVRVHTSPCSYHTLDQTPSSTGIRARHDTPELRTPHCCDFVSSVIAHPCRLRSTESIAYLDFAFTIQKLPVVPFLARFPAAEDHHLRL
jgi:hypothetical protein